MVIPISALSSTSTPAQLQEIDAKTGPPAVYQLRLGAEYRELLPTESSFRDFLRKYEASTGCQVISGEQMQDHFHVTIEVPGEITLMGAGARMDEADQQSWLEAQLVEQRKKLEKEGVGGWTGWRKSLQRRGRVPSISL